jgi:hypothetical protein
MGIMNSGEATGSGLLTTQIFWVAIFGAFAYGYTDDPESLTKSGSEDWIKEFPHFDDDGNGGMGSVDVGHRFHLFFLYMFYLACFQAIAGVLSRLLWDLGCSYELMRILSQLFQLSYLLMTIMWILAFIWRFQPSGRAASGDALGWEDDKDGYCYASGLFIAIMGFVVLLGLLFGGGNYYYKGY